MAEDPEAENTKPASAAHQTPRRRWLRRVLLIGGPVLVALGALYFYVTGGRYVDTENAYVKADMVSISADVSGPIVEVDVRENQPVAGGDELFRIDPAPYRMALAQAEAQLANVRTDIVSLKASYRQKQEELDLARTTVSFTKRTFDRQSKLAASHNTPQTKLDSARHDYDVARQQIAVIQQELAQIRAQLDGNPDIDVEKHPRYLAAEAARDRAALNLERTTVRAPFAGIASKKPEKGQYVTAGTPVMSVVSTSDVWIEANFKETGLTHVRPGQPVSIGVDTYPNRHWTGTVQSIAPASAAEFSVLPAQNATGNWVKVVQRIPVRIAVRTAADGLPLRAGMSTSVEIDTGYQRPVPGFIRTAANWIAGAFAPETAQAKARAQ